MLSAVRRLIRNRDTHHYLQTGGNSGMWTTDVELATSFPNILSAVEAKARLGLKRMDLVLITGDCSSPYDLVLPLTDF